MKRLFIPILALSLLLLAACSASENLMATSGASNVIQNPSQKVLAEGIPIKVTSITSPVWQGDNLTFAIATRPESGIYYFVDEFDDTRVVKPNIASGYYAIADKNGSAVITISGGQTIGIHRLIILVYPVLSERQLWTQRDLPAKDEMGEVITSFIIQ